jgi:hypothetical protein
MNEKYSFADELSVAEKEYSIGGGETFKFREGDNKLRVLSPGKPIATHRISPKEYHTCFGVEQGCQYHEETSPKPGVKFLMWIVDRVDGKVKLAFMPYTIMKALRDLQNNPDYEFDNLPMPYDITVKATKAGTKEVEYSVVPARKNEALTVDEQRAFADQKSVDDVIERMKAKEQNPSIDPEE